MVRTALALVTQSRAGIVYAQGGGGTLREIFEDTEQNYYAKTADDFTPMIFFDLTIFGTETPSLTEAD